MGAKEPTKVDEISNEYLSEIARKAQGDDSVEVTSFELIQADIRSSARR